jgi:hypothetical protein
MNFDCSVTGIRVRIGVVINVREQADDANGLSTQPALQHGSQLSELEGLSRVVLHPRDEAALAIAGHGVGGVT